MSDVVTGIEDSAIEVSFTDFGIMPGDQETPRMGDPAPDHVPTAVFTEDRATSVEGVRTRVQVHGVLWHTRCPQRTDHKQRR
jgi:hypothetical protein